MVKAHLIVWNCQHLQGQRHLQKLLTQKHKFPLAPKLDDDTHLNVPVRLRCTAMPEAGLFAADPQLVSYKQFVCLDLPVPSLTALSQQIRSSQYMFVVIEGAPDHPTVILHFSEPTADLFKTLQANTDEFRFSGYDLPPTECAVVRAPRPKAVLYSALAQENPSLFSLRTEKFLQFPHILTYLFSHVMSLESKEHIKFVSVLKVLSDQLRSLLEPRIKQITKDHHGLWSSFYGDRIAFLDGGVSRIVSLPGTEPMGIRVGIYTVIPGEQDLAKREEWNLQSFVIGDVLGDRSFIHDGDAQTDLKRLQEAGRYILEPLCGYGYCTSSALPPRAMFLHGPLENAVQRYDESDPNYIPALSKDFLQNHGIDESTVLAHVEDVPKSPHGNVPMWNGFLAVYTMLMQDIFRAPLPILGVVERSRSQTFTHSVLRFFAKENMLPKSTRTNIWNTLRKYEIGDELLFGCILDAGEYIEPLPIQKTASHKAHAQWKRVVEQIPMPAATMLKCSENRFPFRVEFNATAAPREAHNLLSLLYHTSLLLPNYSFPVGIDIADKYAKIPDWISRGVSERLTAHVLKKVLETGDDRMLRQVRQLLALSPRDFFFRPKI